MQEMGIEFSVERANFDRDLSGGVVRNLQPVVKTIRCTRGDLVIVKGDKDVLDVSLVDSVSISTQNEGIDEMRPGIYHPYFILATTGTDGLTIESDIDFDPDLIRIHSALREVMSHPHRPQHRF